MANEFSLEDVSQKVFGVSTRRYRQLAKEYAEETGEIFIPEPKAGKIDFVRACKGLIAYYRKAAEGQGSLSLVDERKELVKVQRQLKELELLVKKGELIPRDTVLDEFLRRIAVVRTGLLSFPRSLPGRLAGKDGREMAPIIKRSCSQLLDKYSRKGGVLK